MGYQGVVLILCLPIGQQYKVTMSLYCRKLVPVLMCHEMLLEHIATCGSNAMVGWCFDGLVVVFRRVRLGASMVLWWWFIGHAMVVQKFV